MKQIAILIANENVDLITLSGILEIFKMTNEYIKKTQNRDSFQIDLVCIKENLLMNRHTVHQLTPKCINQIERPDLIFIPAHHNYLNLVEGNEEEKNWIKNCYVQGSEVASLCVGTFLLANTGLLDGKTCSTHWAASNDFQNLFPKVKLSQHEIITDDQGIYTSGGAYSFLNLILHILEKYESRDISLWAAKMFSIDIDRRSQSQFVVFQGQKNHKDKDILKVQYYIEENFEQKILVSKLAEIGCMDSRNFIRRFKKATYNTPLEYIQRVKIEAAKRFLEMSNMNISDIKYSLSWVDDKSFRNIFKKHTGLTPIDYRQKYRKNKT